MQRVIYLATRNPVFTHEEWILQWRAHWRLAASLPESGAIARYIQNEILFDTDPAPRDGIGSAEYVSLEAKAANRASDEYFRIMREDERRVFDRVVRERSFIAEFHLLAGSGLGPFKAVRFVTRRPGHSQAGFFAAWTGDYAARVIDSSPDLLGYAQNHAIEPELAEWGLAVDGSEEFWFDDPDSAREYLLSASLEAMTDAAALFVVNDAVVTNEVVLRDRAYEASW